MSHEEVSTDDERRWLADAGDTERIAYIRAERWITYPRAAAILEQMQRLLDHPRNSRMPSLLIIGESGIGKTQLDLKFCRDHPPQFNEETRRTISPVVSIQLPAAPTDRLLYMTLLRAVGAVFSPRISTATLLRHLPLRKASVLDTAALQTVIRSTRGNTARVFQLFGDLAVAAIGSGEERITTEAISAWRPSVYDRALAG